MQEAHWSSVCGGWEGNDLSISRFLPFSYKGGIVKYKHRMDKRIRDFIEFQIECCPMNEKLLAELKGSMMPRITTNYGASSHGSGNVYRPTEETALRIVSDTYLLQLELSINAVRSVYNRLLPEDQELIRLMYWSNTAYNADGVAMKLCMSRSTVYDRLNNIIVEIGRRLGYVNLGG